jgi:hypothetical protein
MENKLLTIQELEKTWWWKRPENHPELERIILFGYELAARNYELMRRAPNGGEFSQNYLELSREDKTTTSVAWAKPNEFPMRQVFDPQKQEMGWTSVRPQLQWNLQLSDRILKKAFLDYVNQQRNAQAISFAHPLKGKKNRPPTWQYVELLDMQRNKIGNMGDSERGMASKAEQLTTQLFDEFKRAEVRKNEIGKGWMVYQEVDFSEVPEW